MFLTVALTLSLLTLAAEDPKPAKPDLAGAPVYYAHGLIVVFPKGVEEPPADYKGTIGKPMAVIKVDGKVVGEVYSKPLEGTPKEEAKGMAASPDKSPQIELKQQGAEKIGRDEAEFVTLKMNVKGTFGDPWIIHSVYVPRGKACVTFKLVSSEERFASLLPVLKTMLAPDLKEPKDK